jgi:glycosyltransferase involved in cell wall biosynthesis
MRVLHVSTWDAPCGIATYCANLVRALDGQGIQNDVYPLAAHRWAAFTAADVRDLKADIVAQARRYDLVHVQHEHGIFGHATSYKAAARNFGHILRLLRGAGVPAVTTFHTGPLGWNPPARSGQVTTLIRNWNRRRAWRRHVGRLISPAAGGIRGIVHSTITRRALIRSGADPGAIHVMQHGCLPPRILGLEGRSAKARLGLPADAVLLTMFGFVGSYKGHLVAVRALAKLPRRFHLAICGGAHPESRDRHFAAVVRLVAKLGLSDRVTITGWLPAQAAELYYAATDVCLAPYLDPALSASGAITWALASGRPIVASKVPAFQEICREHPCMLLTAPGMADEIAWAAEKLATDADVARQLVAESRRYIEAHSWERTARDTAALYAAILTGAAPEAAGIGRTPVVERPPVAPANADSSGPQQPCGRDAAPLRAAG